MIFTSEMMNGVFALMEQFGATKEQIISVSTVLYQGNIEQADDDDYVMAHMKHAGEHLVHWGKDEASGQPHMIHAIARLILAIERIIRDSPMPTTPDSESSD